MVVGCQPYAPATFTPRNIPDTHFYGLSRPQGHGLVGRKYVTEKSSDNTGNRSRDRPTSSAATPGPLASVPSYFSFRRHSLSRLITSIFIFLQMACHTADTKLCNTFSPEIPYQFSAIIFDVWIFQGTIFKIILTFEPSSSFIIKDSDFSTA